MITGQVSEDEYILAHQVHRRRVAFAMNTAMAVILVLGVAIFLTASKKWGMIAAMGAVGGFIGEFVQAHFAMPARLRRLYAQTQGRVDLTYSWDKDNLFLTSEKGQATRRWTEFPKAREDEKVLLLYYNDALFEIVSKGWFRDQAQVDEFRGHLNLLSRLKRQLWVGSRPIADVRPSLTLALFPEKIDANRHTWAWPCAHRSSISSSKAASTDGSCRQHSRRWPARP